MRRFALPLILSMMPLVACASLFTDERTYPVATQPEAKPAAPEPPPPPPSSHPLPEHKPDAANGETTAELDPKALVGLGFRETEALLGTPTRQEERPPAKIWTYESGDCVLSIFFYADINTREFRALTYDLKENYSTNDGGAANQCLSHWMRRT
ncbi:MAG TPA: hypothetical protein VFE11_00165 [Dongiaceae bacterium]|jgi:hypothetical protein|nr:hypothetical protein [Dongiaceae bacterium]